VRYCSRSCKNLMHSKRTRKYKSSRKGQEEPEGTEDNRGSPGRRDARRRTTRREPPGAATGAQHDLDKDEIRLLIKDADRVARRLCRKLYLGPDDHEDIRQELLAEVIGRLPAFDGNRAPLGAFANVVMAHRAAEIANKLTRERALFGVFPYSLDAPLPGTPDLRWSDTLAEDRGLGAFYGEPLNQVTALEDRLDIERSLALLDLADSTLCAALSRKSVGQLAKAGFGPRRSLYRRIRRIEDDLTAYGLRMRWHISPRRAVED